MNFLKILLSIILFAGALSCVKKPVFPSEPVITYKDFIRYGDPGDPDSTELVLAFTDNEGDIGLDQSDLHGVFKDGNIFMEYYHWDTTGTGHWAYDTLVIFYRAPVILAPGEDSEPIKGLIYVKQERPVYLPVYDSGNKIRYNVYMYDRAMHKSNQITTPDIQF